MVPTRVRTDPGEVRQPVELVLLAVKATQIGHAGAWLETLCDHNTTVCVLQNGVEQVQPVRAALHGFHCGTCGRVRVPPKRNPEGGGGFSGQPEPTLPSASGPVAAIFAGRLAERALVLGQFRTSRLTWIGRRMTRRCRDPRGTYSANSSRKAFITSLRLMFRC